MYPSNRCHMARGLMAGIALPRPFRQNNNHSTCLRRVLSSSIPAHATLLSSYQCFRQRAQKYRYLVGPEINVSSLPLHENPNKTTAYRASTHAHCTNEVPIFVVDRLSSTKNNEAVIGLLDRPQIDARLRTSEQAVGREEAIEVGHRLRLFHADIHAAEIGIVHPEERHELGGRVEDGYVVGNASGCY